MPRTLKILFSHSSVYKRGAWGRTFPLAKALVENNCTVTLLTTNPKFSIRIRVEIIDGVKVIILPEILPKRITSMGYGCLSLVLKVIYSISSKYDISHSDSGHRPNGGIPCIIQKLVYNTPYVTEWYDWFGKGGMYDTKRFLYKIFLGWYELKAEIWDKLIANGVIVTSEVLVNRLLMVKPAAKYIKLFGGAPVEVIPYLENNELVKLKKGFKVNDILLGFINAKNDSIDELKPIIEVLRKGEFQDRFKVLIFGDEKGMSSILPKEVVDSFIFYGWVDFSTEYEILQCVDFFVLFKEETIENLSGWPNCIGDYLACGRQTLLNPIGDVEEFVSNFPDGFIVTDNQTENVYKKLEYLIENMEALMGNRNKVRKIAESEVSWTSKGQQLLKFYYEILKTSKN